MAFYKNGFSVNSRLDKDMFFRLKRNSKKRRLSMSHIIRESLEKNEDLYTDDSEDTNTGRRKTKKTTNH